MFAPMSERADAFSDPSKTLLLEMRCFASKCILEHISTGSQISIYQMEDERLQYIKAPRFYFEVSGNE